MKKWKRGSEHKCIGQAENECRHKNLKFANMGLNSEASQPLNTRKLINVIILGPRKIEESQDQASSTVQISKLLDIKTCPHIFCDDVEGDATLADVGCRYLGSQRFAGQDGEMADAIFEKVRGKKAKGKSW